MPFRSPTEFVITSSVRRDIVGQLSRETTPTSELLSEISASNSAIYDALSTLEESGILSEGTSGWELTAHGQLVADLAENWQTTDEFLTQEPAYWKTHRVDIVPPEFRRRLPEIGAYEIVRDGPREPNKHEEVIISRLERADHCELTTSFYSKKFEDAIPNSTETRMLVTREVAAIAISRFIDGLRESLLKPEECVRRLTQCRFTFVVTDDCLLFRLPVTTAPESDDPSGSESADRQVPSYSLTETTATFISETESAVQWGTDLFASLWDESESLEPYLEREFPELYREFPDG